MSNSSLNHLEYTQSNRNVDGSILSGGWSSQAQHEYMYIWLTWREKGSYKEGKVSDQILIIYSVNSLI